MAGSIFIPLVSVFDPKGISQAKTGMASLAASVKSLKTAAAGAAISLATVGAGNFVKDSVTAARDLERNMVGLGNVFGDLAPRMKGFSEDAAAIGLSQVEASKASTFLGSVLKQSGFEMGIVASETENLVGLAADLSATYGYDLSEALTGMTALFRGEYDPIEKFGVAMKQSEVNALLAARGQDALTGATLRQATAQARLDILYSRSQDAQGAYAQQSGSLFVVQTQLKAAFDNLKASLGDSLTGPMASFLSNFIPLMDKIGVTLTPLFENLGKVLEGLGPVIATKVENILTLIDAINPLVTVLTNLITPLLYPLAGIFSLISNLIKPLIPVITLFAQVLGAVLTPVITFVTFALKLMVWTIGELLKALGRAVGWIPGLGDVFTEAGKHLESFTDDFEELNSMMYGTGVAHNALTSTLSKPIPTTSIDNIVPATKKATTGINKVAEALKKLIQDAVGIQQSIIGSANITGLLETTSTEIVRSVTYLNGRFKVVAFSASKGAKDIVGSFQGQLTTIKTFYKNVQKLSKAGLDPMLLAQIISAGPEAGNATAEAILESGTEGIKTLNKTAGSIKKIAGDLGVIGARAMKKSGMALGNGLIDGLKSQLKPMEASATTVGNTVGTALGNAVGNSMRTTAAGQVTTVVESLVTSVRTELEKHFPGITKDTPTKTTPKTTPKSTPKIVPKSHYSTTLQDMPTFVSSYSAGVPGAGLEGGFKLMESEDIVNPFDKATNPKGFYTFNTNQQKANSYNISINVAPGASGAQVGQALVKSIQEYERVKGKGWRG